MRKGLFFIALIMIGVVASASLALPADRTFAAVDKAWKGEYFQNQELKGKASFVREDPLITFDWGIYPPGNETEVAGWSGDHFSVRWTRRDAFIKDTYVFAARSDDGVRMYVDGKLVIDEWVHRQFHWTATEVAMTAGEHTIVVEFFDDVGRAAIEAGYYPKNPPTATPKPGTKTPIKTPTRTPTGGSGGGGSGGGGSGGSGSKPTSTPRPTRTPSLSGTQNAVVTATPSFLGAEETIVEELDGKLFTVIGFPGMVWREKGYSGSHYYVKNSESKVTFEARWLFRPPQSGFYEVLVYIPPTNAQATRSAVYRIQFNEQDSGQIAVNQTAFADKWVLLGRFFFVPGKVQYVTLTNVTGEANATREVLIDAVMFSYRP